MKGWVTYRKVIRDTVRVRPKHGKMSCGDCRVNEQDFRALEKLTHRPLKRDGAHRQESGCGWFIGRGRSERYKNILKLILFSYFSLNRI